jgi:hypothetical protein
MTSRVTLFHFKKLNYSENNRKEIPSNCMIMNQLNNFRQMGMIALFLFATVIKMANIVTRTNFQDSISIGFCCYWTHLKLTGGFSR